MSYLRAIFTSFRLDKLLLMDILDLSKFYLTIAYHIIMIAFIVWLIKWIVI